MATRHDIYELTGIGGVVAILIDPGVSSTQVWGDWKLALKRAEAHQTLDTDMYPNKESVDSKAVDELQTLHPDWQIVFGGRIIPINTVKLHYRPKQGI